MGRGSSSSGRKMMKLPEIEGVNYSFSPSNDKEKKEIIDEYKRAKRLDDKNDIIKNQNGTYTMVPSVGEPYTGNYEDLKWYLNRNKTWTRAQLNVRTGHKRGLKETLDSGIISKSEYERLIHYHDVDAVRYVSSMENIIRMEKKLNQLAKKK